MKHSIILFVSGILILTGCSKPKQISGILEVPGAIFQYNAEGNGMPCIAFTGSENIGHRLYSDDLRKNLLLIHADPKNISAEQLKKLTLETVIDDIEKVRKTLGFKKIAVMGHSMFGPIPLEYALKYPDNISYSISTGATPYTTNKYFKASEEYWVSEASEDRKNIFKKNLRNYQAADMSSLTPGEKFIKQYIAYTPFRFYNAHFDMTELWEGVEVNMDFVNHFWGVLMRDFDNTGNYKNIKTPVLVIAGKYDFGAPYYLWDDVKEIIPDFTLHVFQNAGHNPMLEIPGEFNEVIFDWIEKKK